MEFGTSERERMVRSGIREITDDYDDDYWREVRNEGRRPTEFEADLAENGWAGIMVPEEYGGQGMGLYEAAIVAEELGRSGGGRTASSTMNAIWSGGILPKHASEATKEEWLPRFAEGDADWSIGVTEPNAGLNTTNIETRARKEGDEWVIDGRKMWPKMGEGIDRLVVLARTLPPEDAESRAHGLTLFLVDPAAPGVEYDEIPVDIYHHSPSYNVYLDGVRVPDSALLGEEHRGLYHFFASGNIERIQIAAAVSGIGSDVLDRACEYAKQREVFEGPIGGHQAIQHPLADAYASLECAKLKVYEAAWKYDHDYENVGEYANVANLKATEAAWDACEAAMTTFGGISVSSDAGIAKFWEEVRHMRTAPISEEMILNYVGEHVLGLPRSY